MKAAMLTVVLLALGACGKAPPEKPADVRAVRVLKVGAAEMAREWEYAGEVRARHETRLAFRVGGKMVERLVELGSAVRAGQPVARLDPADLVLGAASAKAQVASLEAERTLAEAELRRFRELRDKSFISQAEYDRRANAFATAESRLESARAQLRQSANQVAYATLTADTAGVITGIEAEAGQVVAPGQTVAKLARPGELEVSFAVPEAHRDQVSQAAEFSVTLNARPGSEWKARLRELSPAADAVTRTYAARVRILDAGREVELGMSARVKVTAKSQAGRIAVPLAALHSRGDAPQVYVVQADGSVRAQPVQTGGVVGEQVIILSGLRSGDVVVAAGASLLRPGQRVRVLDEK